MERALKSTNATVARPTESRYISPHSNADWEDALASYLGTFKAMEPTECSCGRSLQDTRRVILHCTSQAGPLMCHLTQGSRRELD